MYPSFSAGVKVAPDSRVALTLYIRGIFSIFYVNFDYYFNLFSQKTK